MQHVQIQKYVKNPAVSIRYFIKYSKLENIDLKMADYCIMTSYFYSPKNVVKNR